MACGVRPEHVPRLLARHPALAGPSGPDAALRLPPLRLRFPPSDPKGSLPPKRASFGSSAAGAAARSLGAQGGESGPAPGAAGSAAGARKPAPPRAHVGVCMSGEVVSREWAPIGAWGVGGPGDAAPYARTRLRASAQLLRAAGVPWREVALLTAMLPEVRCASAFLLPSVAFPRARRWQARCAAG